jgi:hypothetical protein
MKSTVLFPILAALLMSLAGCITYILPGGKADLQAFAPPSIQEGFEAKPSNPFPASIAAVRVQGPTYSNYYHSAEWRKVWHGPVFCHHDQRS